MSIDVEDVRLAIGWIENCQINVFGAYTTSKDHVLLDTAPPDGQ